MAAVLYVEKDIDLMRSTFVAIGLAHLCNRLFPPDAGVDTRLVDVGSAYQLQVERYGQPVSREELLEQVAERGLPALLPAIVKPLSSKEQRLVEAGTPAEVVRRRYVPDGFPYRPIDYGAEKARPEQPLGDETREGDISYRSPEFPLWAHLCSYFGKGSAMRVGYPLVLHAWHAHQGEAAEMLLALILSCYGDYPNSVEASGAYWAEHIKPGLGYEHFGLFGWDGGKYRLSTLSVVSPTTAQGLYSQNAVRYFAPDTPDTFWLEVYLAFVGFMAVAMPYRAGGDVLTYYPLPSDIAFSTLHALVAGYREKGYVHSLYRYSNAMPYIKIDALAQISFYQAMVEHYIDNADDTGWGLDAVSGLAGYYYKDISTQIPFNETVFGIPRWLPAVPDHAQLEEARDLLSEHYALIRVLRGDNAEELIVLDHYRRFTTEGEPEAWVDFAIAYNLHRFRAMDDKPWLRLLTLTLLRRTMMTTDDRKDYTPIFENAGFNNIARAIRYCTVQLRYWKDVKKSQTAFRVQHGLGEDLRRHAHNPDRFIEELGEFVADYMRESSNVQASTGETRPFITQSDLQAVAELVNAYGSRVVANLLVAAGYSSDFLREPEQAS